jgi:serine/threonine-protein kinase
VTGEKPAIATEQIKPLSKFNIHLSKAFIYIIERCMERDPSKRFQATASLHEAVANIHKLDSRWKSHQIKATMTAAILAVLFALSCATAFFGWQRMDSEAIEAYNGYVLRIVSENGDSAYESAIALFPENPSAYREQALKLYQAGYYGGCIEYVKSAVAKLSAFGYDAAGIKKIGDIYYILGNAYFTLEDDQNSLTAYDAAIKNNPENFEIYRDFAIALVRCGYIDRAEDMLKGVSGMNMGNDSMNLLRGEIAYAKGSDENAIVLLKEVIKETDSDYIRNRAYLICDRSYRRIPELIDDEIALLQDALRGLPANYLLFIKERLADAYVRDGNYNEALKLLEEFRKSGNIAFATWQNIGILYQKIGDFDNARTVFSEMLAAYPNDYRPPMRFAYLVLEEQGALPNEDRDYGEVALYYEQAFGLFKADDIEMEMLGRLVDELRQNGWI